MTPVPPGPGRAPVARAPPSSPGNDGLWVLAAVRGPSSAPVQLLLALRPAPAALPRGGLSRPYPGGRGTGAQPKHTSSSWALGPSKGPASPRADLRGFLFPSSASVPFISGDGPRERKVTPRGLGSTWNHPLLFPRGRPFPPPTKIPSRWFGSRGIVGGGRRTSLRPEPLIAY